MKMPVTQAELGRRLKAAREACGLTQESVAEKLAVSRPSVALIESGKRAVSSLELDKLAFLLGRDMRDFLREEAFKEEDALVALFRAQPVVAADPQVMEALRECLALGREITNLERLLRIDRTNTTASYPMALPGSRWDAIQQGERIAQEERRRLGLGWAPLGNIAELLEAQGIRTALVELPDDVSGLMINDPTVGLFVVANRRHHVWRRRFSCAHEYGHVLLDSKRISTVSRGTDREELIEVRANAFAAALLMPSQGIRAFLEGLGKGQASRTVAELFDEEAHVSVEGREAPGSQDIQLYDLVQLAYHFDVSRASALYRLKNLRFVSAAEFERLKAEEPQGDSVGEILGLAEPDHVAARNEFQHRFLGLALEAFRRELISRSKLNELAALVQVSRDDLDRLVDETGVDTARRRT
jgi:Zn-dependent peptidase ImmA (M78 family)/transcriptional regulator with XRE-family HTH domain